MTKTPKNSVGILRRIFLLILAIIFLSSISFVPVNAKDSEGADTPAYVSGQVIIKLQKGQVADQTFLRNHGLKSAEKILKRHVFKGEAKRKIEAVGVDRLFLTELDASFDMQRVLKTLAADVRVEYAEPNYIVSTALIPNDPSFSQLWGLHNTGQTGGIPDADIDAPEAWDTTHDTSLVVGVIDTGIDYTHEDLLANMWVNPGEIAGNGIDDDGNGFIDDVYGWDFANNDNDPFDDHGHGTHVAGTIGARGDNGIGVVGVNWAVKIAALKFLNSGGSGSIADAVAALQYANMMGFPITNNSWGGGGFSQALFDAISAGNVDGNLFVAAAGNSGINADVSPMYPAAYDLPNIISVAATDHNDLKAGFSNYGATSVDLGAPGVNVYSTVPTGKCSLCDKTGYRSLNGTSMASPHVAGAAALLWSYYPSLTHLAVKDRILNLSEPISALQGITVSGGRLNIYNFFDTDAIPPSAIVDLSSVTSASNTVTLTWTAVGDDGNTGTANSYDLRYSTSMIDETNFASGTKVSNAPKPQPSGSTEVLAVTGLNPSTTYYFAIKAVDNVGNAGGISNIASGTTTPSPTSLFDDFDPDIDFSQWTNISLGQASINCGSVSGNALYFNGAGTREAVTNGINVTGGGGSINFYLKIGTGSTPCESADFGEDVVLEYSSDGGNIWNLINTYNQDSYSEFTSITESIPVVALSTNTQFRWIQPQHSSGNFDNWALDDVSIVGSETPNDAPVADAGGPYVGTEDILVLFDGSGSFDPDGDVLTYAWDFGDGNTGIDATSTHTYTAGGTYVVTLVVNDGRVDSPPSTSSVEVVEVNDPPVADAGPDQTALIDETLTFDGSGSTDEEGPLASFSWDFGDGSVGSGKIVNHTYSTMGDFTATVTVTDSGGLTAQDTALVSIAIDVVNITKARYISGKTELTIEATSSRGGEAVLTVVGFGTMTYNIKKDIYKFEISEVVNPGTVTVTSSLGGTDTATVTEKGGGGKGGK